MEAPNYGTITTDDAFVGIAELAEETIAKKQDHYNPPFGAITRKTSTPVGVTNIICTSLDGTALTIPFAVAKCGIIGGPLLIVCFGCTTVFTLTCICTAARKLRAASYTEIVYRLFGQACGHLFSFVLFLVLFAILVGFLILARQISTEVLEFMFDHKSIPSELVLLAFGVLCAPLMLAEDLHKLRYACYLGFASIIIVLVCLMYTIEYFPNGSQRYYFDTWKFKYLPSKLSDVLEALPIFTMVFISHFNVLGVYTQLSQPTPQRIGTVIRASVSILVILFSLFGVVGYIIFLELFNGVTSSNILSSFPVHHKPMLAGRICLLVTLICTLPVMIVPARAIITEFYDDLILFWAQRQSIGHLVEELHANLMLERENQHPLHPYSSGAAGSAHHHTDVPRHVIHHGYGNWDSGTLFANRAHHSDHLAPSDSELGISSESSHYSSSPADVHHELPHCEERAAQDNISTASTTTNYSQRTRGAESESDAGLGFGGVEAHWRDWQALVGTIHSLDPAGRSSFQRLLEAEGSLTGAEEEGDLELFEGDAALAPLEIEGGGCQALTRQHTRTSASETGT